MRENEHPDELWEMIKLRKEQGVPQYIQKMNAHMLGGHPALRELKDSSLVREAYDMLTEDVSLAELIRRSK